MLLMDCFINSGVISSEFPTAFYQLSSTAVFTVLITADRVNWICNQRVGSLKGILASPSQLQKNWKKKLCKGKITSLFCSPICSPAYMVLRQWMAGLMGFCRNNWLLIIIAPIV